MTHEYMKSEEVSRIQSVWKEIAETIGQSEALQNCIRLTADWQVLMAENQRFREELELLQAEIAVWKGWRDKLQARTIELFEREKKLVEALRWYADQHNYSIPHLGCAPGVMSDRGKRAQDTLKELGIE